MLGTPNEKSWPGITTNPDFIAGVYSILRGVFLNLLSLRKQRSREISKISVQITVDYSRLQ